METCRVSSWVAALVVAGIGAAMPAAAGAGVWTVWATGEDDFVRPNETYSRRQLENGVWDGRRVRLVSARNEVVAFQVVLQADEAGLAAFSVWLPDLRHASSGATIASAVSPQTPTAGPIRISRISSDLALVPEDAAGAFPVRVDPTRSQAVLVEIYTGRGRATGLYRGAVILHADRQRLLVPVELEVLPFDLPDTSALRVVVPIDHPRPRDAHGRQAYERAWQWARWYRVWLAERLTAGPAAALTGPPPGPAENATGRIEEDSEPHETVGGRLWLVADGAIPTRLYLPFLRAAEGRRAIVSTPTPPRGPRQHPTATRAGALLTAQNGVLVRSRITLTPFAAPSVVLPLGAAEPGDPTQRWIEGAPTVLDDDWRGALVAARATGWRAFAAGQGVWLADAPRASSPSLWWAVFRRAMQDHAYLTLAGRAHLDGDVRDATALVRLRMSADAMESGRRTIGRAVARALAQP